MWILFLHAMSILCLSIYLRITWIICQMSKSHMTVCAVLKQFSFYNQHKTNIAMVTCRSSYLCVYALIYICNRQLPANQLKWQFLSQALWHIALAWDHVFVLFSLYQWLKSKGNIKHTNEQSLSTMSHFPITFKNQSVCQPVEHQSPVTLPAETGLGKDASMVCSVSIDSLPVYYQSGRGTTMLIHSPASAIPLHTRVKSSRAPNSRCDSQQW